MIKRMLPLLFGILVFSSIAVSQTKVPQTKPTRLRARDLGIPFEGTPGQFNAII